MPDHVVMKPADLLRRLRRLATKRGWEMEVREGGRHTMVRLNGRSATVPRHATDMKTGLYRGIMKQLGLTQADMEE